MAESTTVKTKRGLAYILQIGAGLEPEFTRVLCGAGVVSPEEDQTLAEALEDQTAVLEPICEMSTGERQVLDGGCLLIPTRLTSTDVAETVFVTQIGVYANDPDDGEFLYQITQFAYPQTVSSLAANHGVEDSWDHELLVYVKNADAAFFPADPNYQVSRQEFSDHKGDPDAHPEAVAKHNADGEAHPGLRAKVDKLEKDMPEEGLSETLEGIQEELGKKVEASAVSAAVDAHDKATNNHSDIRQAVETLKTEKATLHTSLDALGVTLDENTEYDEIVSKMGNGSICVFSIGVSNAYPNLTPYPNWSNDSAHQVGICEITRHSAAFSSMRYVCGILSSAQGRYTVEFSADYRSNLTPCFSGWTALARGNWRTHTHIGELDLSFSNTLTVADIVEKMSAYSEFVSYVASSDQAELIKPAPNHSSLGSAGILSIRKWTSSFAALSWTSFAVEDGRNKFMEWGGYYYLGSGVWTGWTQRGAGNWIYSSDSAAFGLEITEQTTADDLVTALPRQARFSHSVSSALPGLLSPDMPTAGLLEAIKHAEGRTLLRYTSYATRGGTAAVQLWHGWYYGQGSFQPEDWTRVATEHEGANGFTFYKSLSELGIAEGTESMAAIAAAMANNSILLYAKGTANTSDAYPATAGVLQVVRSNQNRVIFQFDNHASAGSAWQRRQTWSAIYEASASPAFSGWHPVNVRPTLISLPLASGVTDRGGSNYWRDSTWQMGVKLDIARSSGYFTDGQVVATLPTGYGPSGTITSAVVAINNNNGVFSRSIGVAMVTSSGEISVSFNTSNVNIIQGSIFGI